jgi:hypothetical protein
MLIIWRMISIAKTIVGKHDQNSEYLVPTNTLWNKDGHKNMYANVEFGGNGKTRSIAMCQINTMKKIGTIKDNGKVIAKSKQQFV